jgi:hypothetical protein
MSGIKGGNRIKRITRRTNKKLSKKLTKKDRKRKMKGGKVVLAVRNNFGTGPRSSSATTISSSATRSKKLLQPTIDPDTADYLSTYSVEHFLTYLRFNNIVTEPDDLVQYLKRELTYPGIERTPNSDIHEKKDKEQMIKLFLGQAKPNDACRLLRVLLQFPIYDNDMTYYNNYIDKVMTITDEGIKNSYLNLTFPSDKDQIF